MGSNPGLTPGMGADGIATEAPIITLTEKILEEKEQQLRKYIQDNYSKIRDVERELSGLAMEVKLTAGPKKAALEHMRKKIEQSADRIKAAKLKETQAKKAWEAAAKVLQDEEHYKATLCEDLNRLVQESAAAQYSRLEDLTRRLEALNPGLGGATEQIFGNGIKPHVTATEQVAQDNSKSTEEVDVKTRNTPQGNGSGNANTQIDGDTATGVSTPHDLQEPSAFDSPINSPGSGKRVSPGQHVSIRGRGRGVGRAKGVLVQSRHRALEDAWTGAGFDVHDSQT